MALSLQLDEGREVTSEVHPTHGQTYQLRTLLLILCKGGREGGREGGRAGKEGRREGEKEMRKGRKGGREGGRERRKLQHTSNQTITALPKCRILSEYFGFF